GGEDLHEKNTARYDDGVGRTEEDAEVEGQSPCEEVEVQAERRVERQSLMDHRVERRDPGDFRMPGGPDAFDPDEADAMDVDHVDPHLLDQVRLPAREHGEPVARIVAELLRPDVDGPGLPLPAAMGVFRREDDDLVAVA